ncbi:protein FAM200B-like [Belonocnema kinseyi]|uniref:protein FAM200B-like n=1 Tax=Belonocnema kinseyi TaxID=2817044 RepID=UPI00143D01C2|nr:protein FAM200B-like [Belonocnema kinseyi]
MSDCLKYGFRMQESGDPQCLICLQLFSAATKPPSKIKRHYERKHPESLNIPTEVFASKLREIEVLEEKERESVDSGSNLADSEESRLRQKLCECSYSAALAIPRYSLLRITELGMDMRSQLKNELNSTENFAIQVDGSTDVSNVKLLGFVRFIGKEDTEE